MAQHLDLPGEDSHSAETPDHADFTFAGDFELRADLALDDFTPAAVNDIISQWGGNERAWVWYVQANGNLAFTMSLSAAVKTHTRDMTGVATDAERIQLRMTADVDNGAGGNDVAFYTRSDGLILPDTGWTELGVTSTIAGTGTIDASTRDVHIGASEGGTVNEAAGNFYQVIAYATPGGTIIADFNASDFTLGDSDTDTAVGSAGKTWTINGTNSEIKSDAKN